MASSKVFFNIFLKTSTNTGQFLPSCGIIPKRIHTKTTLRAPPLPTELAPQSSDVDEAAEANGEGTDTISKAMHSYIQRAKEHQEFMDKEEKEFVFGRRHLANMMGKDPETFSQADINEAIRYLFPSGLFEPTARPMMRPPQEIYPKQKAAQFDMSGRPHHPFFYTANPNFFYLMHEMVSKINKMNASAGGLLVSDNNTNVAFAGSVWLPKHELEQRLMETLSDKQYTEWISCLERIAQHPEFEKELAFLKGYRKELTKQTKVDELPSVTLEPDGRKSCFIPVCMKKSARGEVKVTLPGTGRFNINNGQGLEYFTMTQSREVVLTPLQLAGWLGKVDVDAYVQGGTEFAEHQSYGGEASRAACLRWGISTAIAALGADAERLRLAGLLVRDHRQRERQKCGHDGARAKWTWKKR